jgi:hypothetical protein
MGIKDELIAQFDQLDEAQQHRLLNFARILANTPDVKGEPGPQIIQAVGFFDLDALDEMEAAIEEACEEIDWREWE